MLPSKRRKDRRRDSPIKGQGSRGTAWQEAHTKGHIKNSTASIKQIGVNEQERERARAREGGSMLRTEMRNRLLLKRRTFIQSPGGGRLSNLFLFCSPKQINYIQRTPQQERKENLKEKKIKHE